MDWKKCVDDDLAGAVVVIPGEGYGGLSRENALRACEGFARRDVGVLGGDVWIRAGSRFRAAGELGWHTDRGADEAWFDFRERSIAKAVAAISREVLLQEGEEVFCVLVCTTELESSKHRYGRS